MSDRTSQIWGLTGGIASGKSTAARFFSEAGIPVLDADVIARALTEKGGAAESQVKAEFGTTDRAKLREMVFADPAKRTRLEAILHPLIQTESARKLAELSRRHPKGAVIYEATLLVETGRYKDFDGLIVVHAPRALRKQRLMARSQVSDELAEKILNSQATDEARLAAADVVLDNANNEEELRSRISDFVRARGW